jgi:hypothetical protein
VQTPRPQTPLFTPPATAASRPADTRRIPRLELHNACVDEAVARDGACGFTHLPTGRTCTLRHRHRGPCNFVPRDDAAGVPAEMLDRSATSRDRQRGVSVVAKTY